MRIKSSTHGLMRLFIGTAALWVATYIPAGAADLADTPASDEWVISIAPYAWAAGLSGDVGLFGREPVELDMSFSDILNELKFAAMGVVEAHNGTFGIFGDIMYVHTEAEEGISRTVENIPVSLKATVDTENIAATLMGEYRLINDESIKLDLMGGARLWHVANDISARLKADGVEVAELSGDDSETWVDPMVGLRTRINTETPLYLEGWGLIGGAGIGSDLAWDVMGGVGYQWTGGFSTVVGYRAMGVDYSHDGFVFDVVEQGAFVGGVFTF